MSASSSRWATLIALDPGGTTGWSVVSVHPEALIDPALRILDNINHWSQGELAGSESSQKGGLVALLDAWDAPVLMERFTLRKYIKSRDLLAPVRISAHVEWLCEEGIDMQFDGAHYEFGPRPYDWQNPDEAMVTATDARLQEWGLYRREGGLGHARDATRHWVTYLRAAKGESQGRARRLKLLWPQLYGDQGEMPAGRPPVVRR